LNRNAKHDPLLQGMQYKGPIQYREGKRHQVLEEFPLELYSVYLFHTDN